MAQDFFKKYARELAKKGLQINLAEDGAKARGFLSTGNYALNWAVSGRFQQGWPLGHVVELFGDPATGKSLVAARAIANAQDAEFEAVVLDDTEYAFNKDWARRTLGIDPAKLMYTNSGTVEDHEQALAGFLALLGERKTKGLFILDSLAALSTKHEQSVGLEKVSMTRAKSIRTLFRLHGNTIGQQDVLYLICNHTIANIGSMFESRTTPGGGGSKFQSSVRVEMLPMKKLYGEDRSDIVGAKCKAFVQKNRIAPPFRRVEFVVPYFYKLQPHSGLLKALYDLQIIGSTKRHTILYRGADTGIYLYKTDETMEKQDISALELIDKHPDILDVADNYLAEYEEALSLGETKEGEESEEEEEEEE